MTQTRSDVIWTAAFWAVIGSAFAAVLLWQVIHDTDPCYPEGFYRDGQGDLVVCDDLRP